MIASVCIVLSTLAAYGCTNTSTVLRIDSNPVASQVTLNQQPVGETPLRISDLAKGMYVVNISSDGYEPWAAEISLSGQESIYARLVPTPKPEVKTIPYREMPETRLSVFTEPSGAYVVIDGKNWGTGTPDNAIVVSYDDRPTVALVKVTLPGFTDWVEQIDLQAEKDNRVFVKLEPLPEWFQYPSDDAFLRRTVNDAIANMITTPTLKQVGKIAVVAMEKNIESGDPIHSMLQDAFTQALTVGGYQIAERDDQLLVQIAHSSVGDSIPFRILTHHGGPDDPFIYDAEIAARERGDFTIVTEEYDENEKIDDQEPHWSTDPKEDVRIDSKRSVRKTTERKTKTLYTLTSNVPTADQLVAYRILQCDISKTPVRTGEERSEPMLFRLAKVRVHVRVINAKTGTTTWARVLSRDRVDEIPERVSEALATQ